ncbi:MAG: hypothetical protein OHK0019_12970 [Saprospiraceae bacterium]
MKATILLLPAKALVTVGFLLSSIALFAQTSTLRGVVMDKQAETPLVGATIQILNFEPAIGAMTDAD